MMGVPQLLFCSSSVVPVSFRFAASNRFAIHATASDSNQEEATDADADADADAGGGDEEDKFEDRLSRVQLRYRVGTGKKAELRKMRKGGPSSESSSSGISSPGMYLPSVPLKDPISDGMKVEFGFSPYSERANGRIAILGIAALLLVELATGKSVLTYHSPSIVMTQLYFVAAMGAMYIKYEKEKSSFWPQ